MRTNEFGEFRQNLPQLNLDILPKLPLKFVKNAQNKANWNQFSLSCTKITSCQNKKNWLFTKKKVVTENVNFFSIFLTYQIFTFLLEDYLKNLLHLTFRKARPFFADLGTLAWSFFHSILIQILTILAIFCRPYVHQTDGILIGTLKKLDFSCNNFILKLKNDFLSRSDGG